MLDHPEPVRQRDSAREAPRERAERRLVVALEDQQVLSAGTLGLGVKAQQRAVHAGDLLEIGGEGDGRRFARLAVDPHRALGAHRRIVDALHEIPGERLTEWWWSAGVGQS